MATLRFKKIEYLGEGGKNLYLKIFINIVYIKRR